MAKQVQPKGKAKTKASSSQARQPDAEAIRDSTSVDQFVAVLPMCFKGSLGFIACRWVIWSAEYNVKCRSAAFNKYGDRIGAGVHLAQRAWAIVAAHGAQALPSSRVVVHLQTR